MPSLRSASFLFLLTFCAAWLAGCESSGTGPAGTGPELASGSYFIQYDSDDAYRYEQYFVVQPGYHWEFVEYGYVAGTKTLCQLTRHKGNYSSTDTSLTLTVTAAGNSVEKCGMTKADFNAFPFQAAPAGAKETFPMRNATATSFEAEDLFQGTASGWMTYTMKPDPYGFY